MTLKGLLALLVGVALGAEGVGFAWGQVVIVTPSLTVSEEYDDNVFLSSTDRQSDFLTVVSPGLRLESRGHPWDVTLAGSVRGEAFAERSELNNVADAWQASATVELRPTRLFNVSLTDRFVRSLNPLEVDRARREVDPETGVPFTGRFTSSSNTVTSAATYQINRVTLLEFQYSLSMFRSDSPVPEDSDAQAGELSLERRFSPRDSGALRYSFDRFRSDLLDARDSDTHGAEFSLERHFLPRTSVTLRYSFRRFQVEGNPDQDSHAPRVGLSHGVSPTIRVFAEGGPLFLEGAEGSTEIGVTGALGYEQQFRRGTFSLAYDRSAQLAGRIGAAGVSQSLAATLSFHVTRTTALAADATVTDTDSPATADELRVYSATVGINYEPLRSLSMGLQSTFRDAQSSARTRDFRAYLAAIQVNYRLGKWLSIQAGYDFERQDDRAGPNDLERNVFSLSLVASDQFRAY